MGWMYYWLLFVFFCLFGCAILCTVFLSMDEDFVFLILVLWILVLFFLVVLVFGFQITMITEHGILQKQLFRKQLFLDWGT